MNGRSRSTLFLMEQLIVILVFAVCAAVCVSIFAGSHVMAGDSRDMSHAMARAESAAECFKAFSGNYEKVAEALGGISDGSGYFLVYYDSEWRLCGEAEATYVMHVTGRDEADVPASLALADITVGKIAAGEIIALTVAARGETG